MYATTTAAKTASVAPLGLHAQTALAQQDLGMRFGTNVPDRIAAVFDGLGGVPVRFERNDTIYFEGDDVGACYKVVSGMVRLCKLTEDGRRQITSFLMAGDVFGWTDRDTRAFSAEAVTDVRLEKLSRSRIEDAMRKDSVMGRSFLTLISGQLAAAHDHLLLLGRMTASERIASFLLNLVKRLRNTGAKPGALELAMNRKDIADYLGLTVETVSRVMSKLKRSGIITLPTPEHVGLNRTEALERMAMAD